MKTRLLSLLVALFAATLAASAPALAEGRGASDAVAPHYYVALGDSLAQGHQPTGDVGHGYADQLYAALKTDDPTLQLVKLGCADTTTSMIDGNYPWPALGSRYFCGYRAGSAQLAHGSQLADAVAFLRAHGQFVSLVTIDVGGGEAVPCVAEVDQACLTEAIAAIEQNLPVILSTLRDAAGPDVPIIGMNYYNPFLAFWDLSAAYAAATNAMMVGQLNPTLEQVYAEANVPVADVEAAFSTTDWTLVDGTPRNVVRICQWTWMCDPTFGPDIHANTAGYGVIAQSFAAVLP